jgi:hypothetical protein
MGLTPPIIGCTGEVDVVSSAIVAVIRAMRVMGKVIEFEGPLLAVTDRVIS